MSRSLKIAIADDELDMRDYFQQILPLLGHHVIAVARDGRELVELCAATRPDLVITDIKMPDMDGIEAATRIYQNAPVPVILVSAFHDPEFISRAEADHILAYLVKPIKQADLEPAIGIAMRRFEQFQALRKETSDLKQALEDRKLIEKAKGILMKKAGLDEHDAFRRLAEAGQRQEPQADRDRPDDLDRRRGPRAAETLVTHVGNRSGRCPHDCHVLARECPLATSTMRSHARLRRSSSRDRENPSKPRFSRRKQNATTGVAIAIATPAKTSIADPAWRSYRLAKRMPPPREPQARSWPPP